MEVSKLLHQTSYRRAQRELPLWKLLLGGFLVLLLALAIAAMCLGINPLHLGELDW